MENVRLAYRVAEFAAAMGISRSKAYEVIASGEVPSINVGGCKRVPIESARAYIANQLAENGKAPEAA